jgi:exonuclease 1
MGVSGLLKIIKSITNTEFHISSLKGYRVAIDAYCWLHKGSYHCSEALALGQPTTFFVDYILNWISFLQNVGIREIIVVFDGMSLKMKEDTAT